MEGGEDCSRQREQLNSKALSQEAARVCWEVQGAVVAEGCRAKGRRVDDGIGKSAADQSRSPTIRTVALTLSEMGTIGGFLSRDMTRSDLSFKRIRLDEALIGWPSTSNLISHSSSTSWGLLGSNDKIDKDIGPGRKISRGTMAQSKQTKGWPAPSI